MAPAHLGYPALFVLVAAESAGVPVPGETALVAAAVLAAMGHLEIGLVVALAALGAVVGDNVGYGSAGSAADDCRSALARCRSAACGVSTALDLVESQRAGERVEELSGAAAWRGSLMDECG